MGVRFGVKSHESKKLLARHVTHANPVPIKNAKPKLRNILWKMIPPLNSLYYLALVKDLHFEPYAERFEHETPLWFLIQKYPKALGQEKISAKEEREQLEI